MDARKDDWNEPYKRQNDDYQSLGSAHHKCRTQRQSVGQKPSGELPRNSDACEHVDCSPRRGLMKHNIGRRIADDILSDEVPTNIYLSQKEKRGAFNSFQLNVKGLVVK